MNSAVIFQGQGSYRTFYFKKLLSEKPELKSYLETAEKILGWSPENILSSNDNIGALSTEYAQPMIFLMEAISWYAYKDKLPEKPEFMLGHSLGEITALTAAGIFSFEQGLEIVKVRGKLMQESGGPVPQGMLAVLGLEPFEVEELCKQATKAVGELVFCANYNGEGNIVISGAQEALNYIVACENIKCRPLQVTKAFHTEYMKQAAEKFRSFLNTIECNEFVTPVISNVTAKPYQSSWSVKDILYRQIFSPVYWLDSIRFLKKRGIDLLLQVSDSGLFQAMDRDSSSTVFWGNIKEWADGTYYNYNFLYPASRYKKMYRAEIGGEILSTMIADPWPADTNLSVICLACERYKAVAAIFENTSFSYEELMKTIVTLKEILLMKQNHTDDVSKKCRQILKKYGIEIREEDEELL